MDRRRPAVFIPPLRLPRRTRGPLCCAELKIGVRVQIVVALALLLVVAFVPLNFAVARLSEVALGSAKREMAREVGRSVALRAQAAESSAELDSELSNVVEAIAVYGEEGELLLSSGDGGGLPPAVVPGRESIRDTRAAGDVSFLVVVPGPSRTVATVVRLGVDSASTTPLVRLVALYSGVVALALLVFAYFAMTRLVVQPIDAISVAASRIAGGARALEVPASRTREFAELTDSLTTMLTKLLANEALLLSKIDELTERSEELRQAQDSIVRAERLASVGRLAAGIAHEIGNPIAALLGFEELLLAGGLEKEEERDFLRRMKAETDRVHRVLRDLLDFARSKGGGPESERDGSCSVVDTIEIVAALVRPQKHMHGKSLEVETDVEPGAAIAAERLQQVLLNLLLNAAYAAKGRVLVTVTEEPASVVIAVEDDGAGLAPEIRGRLFEPFATTKEVGEGTGLGLAVCRGLVERARGSILAEDGGRLGGARFVVRLPRVT
jgi:two-component system, NtrC family, sensor kinase